jgi:Holliday junction resolvase RusA-like endonuclease
MTTIDLPMPPSVNRIWRVGAGGRVYRDPEYVAWQRLAGWELAAQRPDKLPARTAVAVTIRAGRPKRARDVDNLGKALLDLLQAHRVIANDADVADLRIVWDTAIEPGRVRVDVRAIEKEAV